MSTFRENAIAMATARPRMTAATLVSLALALEAQSPPDLDDAQALAQWAMFQPKVAVEVRADKKIHAIKELRQLTNCSLLQAKKAIEAVQ